MNDRPKTNPHARGNRARKRQVKELLHEGRIEDVAQQALEDSAVSRALFSLALDPEPLVQWRAIHAIGAWAGERADRNLDPVRDLLRRQIWAMTDESGNVPWMATWIIGSILRHVPELVGEFGPLLGQYLYESPFEAGAGFAIGQCARHAPESVRPTIPLLIYELQNKTPLRRALAVRALAHLQTPEAREPLTGLTDDAAPVELYRFDERGLKPTTVGELAQQALAQLD